MPSTPSNPFPHLSKNVQERSEPRRRTRKRHPVTPQQEATVSQQPAQPTDAEKRAAAINAIPARVPAGQPVRVLNTDAEPTPAQLGKAHVLNNQRRHPQALVPQQVAESAAKVKAFIDSPERNRAELSATIDMLKSWPVRTAEPVAQQEAFVDQLVAKPTERAPFVEKGYYAVEHDGVLKFFRVSDRGFLTVQASDDFHPVRSPETRTEVKRLIAADPHAAAVRYGQQIGRCYVCNRTLTDETSRALGIGPTCRER